MQGKMKKIMLTGAKQFEVFEVDIPQIQAPDEVLVKVKAVGVCGSDLEAWRGHHAHVTFPVVPGHEFVGEVIAVGEAVTDIKVGDRVVKEPIDYCGHCYACTHGQPNVCKELKVYGFEVDGGHLEYFVSKANKVFKFPETVDWKYAAMLEPYTIAAQVNQRTNVLPGDVVLVHGLGPAGIAVADWAKVNGATVIATDMVPKRLEMGELFGLDYVFDASKVDVKAKALEITDGEGPNVIVDTTGVPALTQEALELVSPAGRIASIAFNFSPTPLVTGWINVKEISYVGSRLQSYQFQKVIDKLDKHIDNIKKMVTHVFPYTEIEQAFELAASRDPKVCKVVVTYDD